MKKLVLCILLILLLCGCQKKLNISDTLFIASIGIEKEEEQYVGYFYLPLSSDIGKSESNENKAKGEYAKVKGESIADLFCNMVAATSFQLNFRHVSSIVLNEKLLKKDFLNELSDYIKFSLDIDFNLYLFVTEEKMSEIYDFQNPNQESVLNSILVSTSDTKGTFLVAEPLHFLHFAQLFYAERRILFPLLDLSEIWTIEDKQTKNSHCQRAVYYFQEKVGLVIDHPSSPYVKSTESFEDRIEDQAIYFQSYRVKPSFKDDFVLKVSLKYKMLKTKSDIDDEKVKVFVEDKIRKYIEEYQAYDPYDLAYYSKVYSKSLSYDKMKIEITISKN